MSNNSKSIAIEDRIDLKAFTFDCLHAAIELLKSGKIEGISMDSDNKVIILTNFGIVEGTPIPIKPSDSVEEENTKDTFVKILYEQVFKSRNEQISKLAFENKKLRLVNDTAALVLKDAIIRPYSNPMANFKIDNMILFTDQIVGLSFGQMSSTSE